MAFFDRAGEPISMGQWFWLFATGDPHGGPDHSPDPGVGEIGDPAAADKAVAALSSALALGQIVAPQAVPEGGSEGDPEGDSEGLAGEPSLRVAVQMLEEAADGAGAPLEPDAAMGYRSVGLVKIGQYEVSTVWTGIDFTGSEDARIFETRVESSTGEFPSEHGWGEIVFTTSRYHDEAAAAAGHARICDHLARVTAA